MVTPQTISRRKTSITVLKNVEGDLWCSPHNVRWVFDIASVGPVVGVFQVMDDNGTVFPARVPDPLNTLLEGPNVVNVMLAFGVVKYLGLNKSKRIGGTKVTTCLEESDQAAIYMEPQEGSRG